MPLLMPSKWDQYLHQELISDHICLGTYSTHFICILYANEIIWHCFPCANYCKIDRDVPQTPLFWSKEVIWCSTKIALAKLFWVYPACIIHIKLVSIDRAVLELLSKTLFWIFWFITKKPLGLLTFFEILWQVTKVLI